MQSSNTEPPNTPLYMNPHGDEVFLTPSGAIGMEHNGRTSIHTIEQWIAYSWNDLTNTHTRNFPSEATLAYGPGDQSTSLKGQPYER